MADAHVVHNPEERRYELHLDGRRVGFTEYVERGGRLLFVHTETDPALQGQGLASELIRQTLDQVRATGKPIVPLCPFVAAYVERHPEYADLVDHDLVARIDQRS